MLDDDGGWVYDDDKLQSLAVDFYRSLCSSSRPSYVVFQTAHCFPSIDLEDWRLLNKNVGLEETRKALCLAHCIDDSVSADTWKPLGFCHEAGMKISHFFVDDILWVSKASQVQVDEVKSILDLFCFFSGQKVNLQKSSVYFSSNVHASTADSLSRSLGVPTTHALGKYLGFPVIHHRVSKQSYEFLVDKVRKKLSGWKARTLSFAGRWNEGIKYPQSVKVE